MVLILSIERQWHHARAMLRCQRMLLITMAVTMMFSGVALFSLAPRLGLTTNLAASASRFGLEGGNLLPFILCFAFTNGWLEELYWRGYLGSASKKLSWFDLWFAGYHVLVLALFIDWWWALAAMIILIGAAWMWRQTMRISDGLLVNVLSHIGVDLSILLAVWAIVVGSSND